MTERTYVVQKTQLGVESVPGTAVAATKRLLATSIEFEPQAVTQEFTPLGSKYVEVVAEQKEWMQASLKGYPAFDDMVYLLSSVMSAPTVTVSGGGHKWAFDSAVSALDSPKTLTVEQGDATRAQRFAGGIVKTLGLKITRQTADVSGTMLGHRLEDGITMSTGVTELPLIPMLASGFDIFMDPSDGTSSPPFGTTKLARIFDTDFSLDNRYGPFWPIDSAQTSYAGTVELAPTLENKIVVEADAAGMGLLNTLRAGSTVMIRIRNVGPMMVDGITPYSFTLDMAAKVSMPDKYSDQEGIYAIGWTLKGVEDPGWGKAIHAEVICDLAAL